jgi:hypothetical protein
MTDQKKQGDRRQDGGLGDDQGTRIGAPDPGAPRDGKGDRGQGPLGSGSEALKDGTETDRTHEHKSGYGGEKGEPRTSSDTRPSE